MLSKKQKSMGFFSSIITIVLSICPRELPMVVIIPSHNNSQWHQRNLDSVYSQQYSNYRVLYCDDASTDDTVALVKNYVAESGQEHRTGIIVNEVNRGALFNWYRAVHQCLDNEIIVSLDGSDWFENDQVLARINKEYADLEVWMTYGQYKIYSTGELGNSQEVSSRVIEKNCYRETDWPASHLKTFYAGLFKKISLKDFFHQGRFFSVSADVAFMLPMLEMAGMHSRFISDVLYAYNGETQEGDDIFDSIELVDCNHQIRTFDKYAPLEQLDVYGKKRIVCPVDMIIFSDEEKEAIDACCKRIQKYIVGYGSLCSIDKNKPINDFKKMLLSSIMHGDSEYVVFVESGKEFPEVLDLFACSAALRKTGAYGFYADRSGAMLEGSQSVSAYEKLPGGIIAWQFNYGQQQWRQPHVMHLAVYKKQQIAMLLATLDFSDIDSLQSAWNFMRYNINEIGLCFA